MAKSSVQYECQECGSVSPRWQGKCAQCQAWNSMIESVTKTSKAATGPQRYPDPVPITTVVQTPVQVLPTGISELDQVLGKGLVPGSVILLGGEPGIGKSTVSLQMAASLAQSGQKVLYVSAEESDQQLALRSQRLAAQSEQLFVLAHQQMADIMAILDKMKPDVVILDSIQVVAHQELTAIEGTVSQVRYCANELIHWVKAHDAVGVMIGHITKEGSLAGPKVLEHMVDVILYLEGERNQQYRLLRCYKNRFSGTGQLGVFEMNKRGLIGVQNPSELFIDMSSLENPGSMISAIIDGNRVFLVEVQALVVASGYGMAKRNFVGVDSNRANLMIATIEKSLNIRLGDKDIFLNIIGGLKVNQPSIDCAIIMAILSSLRDQANREKVGLIGEVGLAGEVRPVPGIDKRLAELDKMGFSMCFIPSKNMTGLDLSEIKLSVIGVSHVEDLITRYFQEAKRVCERVG